MPNPRVHRNGELVIGLQALDRQPTLARMMMNVIVRWNIVETHIAMAFTSLLPHESASAHEIYHAFFDPSQRRRVFLSVAKSKLPPNLVSETEVFLDNSRRLSEDRNIVAHSLWCYSPSAPKCICTIDQKTITNDFLERMQDVIKNPGAPNVTPDEYGRGSRLIAYSEADFTKMLERMDKLDKEGLSLASKFASAVFPL